jgi:hypothetical protein
LLIEANLKMNDDILFAGVTLYTVTTAWAYWRHRIALKEMLRVDENKSNLYLIYKGVELLRQERTNKKFEMQKFKL